MRVAKSRIDAVNRLLPPLAFIGAAVWIFAEFLGNPYAVDDDVRALYWLLRSKEPALFPNDPHAQTLARFWPLGLQAIYRGLLSIFSSFVTAAKALSLACVGTTLWFIFQIGKRRHGSSGGWVLSLLVLLFFSSDGFVFGATARALAPPLLALAWYGAESGRSVLIWGSAVLAATIYPQVVPPIALLGIGYTVRDRKPEKTNTSRRAWIVAGTGLLLTVAAAGLTLSRGAGLSDLDLPTYRQIHRDPHYGAGNREDWQRLTSLDPRTVFSSRFVEQQLFYASTDESPVSGVGWLCLGLLAFSVAAASKAHRRADPEFVVAFSLAAFAAFFLLAGRGIADPVIRHRQLYWAAATLIALTAVLRRDFSRRIGWVPFCLLVGGVLAMTVVHLSYPLLSVRLHQSRTYVRTIIPFFLAIGTLEWFVFASSRNPRTKCCAYASGFAAGLLLLATVPARYAICTDLPLYERIAREPPSRLIAGPPAVMDCVPIFAKRSVTASHEIMNPIARSVWVRSVEPELTDYYEALFSPTFEGIGNYCVSHPNTVFIYSPAQLTPPDFGPDRSIGAGALRPLLTPLRVRADRAFLKSPPQATVSWTAGPFHAIVCDYFSSAEHRR